jgi:hypothetical protein
LTVIAMKLADRYGGMLDSPTPTSVLALLGITPVIIAYLAHVPDTKPLRLGAWLLGLTAYVWTVLTIEISPGRSAEPSAPPRVRCGKSR